MKSTPKDIESFIKDYLREIEEDNAAIFAGAGLSVPSGYVDWKILLKEVAEDLGLEIDKEDDLISLAQYHLNKHANNRHELNQKLINEFSTGKKPNINQEILARMPIRTYWTTNYDKLIEKALENANKIVDVKYTTPHLAKTVHKRDTIVYKMHGDIDHPDEAVLVKDQYEKYYFTHGPYINALSGDLISKTFLFLGFSFTDPNLDYILSRIRVNYQTNQRHHYCIFREVKQGKETQEDYEYKQLKQSLLIQDLKRFNIRVLLVSEYQDITAILNELESRFKQKTVFISGSAHEYGSWGKERSEEFISKLSKELVKNEYKIVSGFGLGVGSAVISGVLEEVYMNKKENLKDQLLLRPFPQGNEEIKNQWETYRRDMIDYAGIAIFLFGNKFADGTLKPADGVRREFEIAREKGLIVLPLGATGYIATELWAETLKRSADFLKENNLTELYEKLGASTDDPEGLIEPVLQILKAINKK